MTKTDQKYFLGDNGKFYNLYYEQVFLEQDGNKMFANVPDYFSTLFDWQVTRSRIYKNGIEEPNTIYLKTDFLPFFVYSVLPQIKNEFILITACSDFSPQVNYNEFHWKKYYQILINNPKLKFWYMNNMRYKNEKTFSLPAGFGASAGNFWPGCTEKEADEFILKKSQSINRNEKIDKIFCSFRDRITNVCGHDMVIRPEMTKIIENNKSLFNVYEPNMAFKEFVDTISKYKYALIPHGNGMDPNPTCWISLALQTIPVIYKTPNSADMFVETNSVIFFENLDDIIKKDLYVDKDPIDFEFLTCKYWANKIKSKI